MPRPRLCRKIMQEPGVTYFKPAGIRIIDLEETKLTVDELEAIKLKDLLKLEQKEAAKKMGVSQPTLFRLLQSARKKIADALVNGKAIKIKGGNYKLDKMIKCSEMREKEYLERERKKGIGGKRK